MLIPAFSFICFFIINPLGYTHESDLCFLPFQNKDWGRICEEPFKTFTDSISCTRRRVSIAMFFFVFFFCIITLYHFHLALWDDLVFYSFNTFRCWLQEIKLQSLHIFWMVHTLGLLVSGSVFVLYCSFIWSHMRGNCTFIFNGKTVA